MDSTIIAAFIGAVATILAALIGLWAGQKRGYEEGFKMGGKHSILRFMDVHGKDIGRAISSIKTGDKGRTRDIAHGIVENVKVWRRIQGNFRDMLNGLIDKLEHSLHSGDSEEIQSALWALHESFEGKKLAVETELRKSQI